MTNTQVMEKRVNQRRRRNKIQTEIIYKKSRVKRPVMQLKNSEQKVRFHKTVYLPDFEEYETFRPLDYKDIHSLLN